MAERPELYRAIRFGDAIALVVAAAALTFAATAQADVKQRPERLRPVGRRADARLRQGRRATPRSSPRASGPEPLIGTDPSIADKFAAVIDGQNVRILGRPGFAEVDSFDAPGVDAVAVSNNWIAYRTRIDGRDRLIARKLDDAGVAGEPKSIAAAGQPDQVSLPEPRRQHPRLCDQHPEVEPDHQGDRSRR